MLYMDTYALQNMQDRVRRILRIKNYATLKDGEIVVRIPEIKGRMTGHETSSGEEIITYIYQRWYDKEAKQMRNRKADIGKVVPWYSTAMYPTDRYEEFFDMETGKLKHPPEDEEMPADEQDVKKEQQKKTTVKSQSEPGTQNHPDKGTVQTEGDKHQESEEDLDQIIKESLKDLRARGAEYIRKEKEKKLQADEKQRRRELYGEEAFAESEQREARRRLDAIAQRYRDEMETTDEAGTAGGDETQATDEEELQKEYSEYEQYIERIAVLFQILNQIQESIKIRTKKRPDEIINRYKAQQINRILAEIREAYGGSNYEDLLGMIEEPKEEEQDGKTVMTGMTYSDAEIVLAHYAAITKFIRIKKLEDLKT